MALELSEVPDIEEACKIEETGKTVCVENFRMRRLTIQKVKGEHTLNMGIIIEDLRAAVYIAFTTLAIIGVILTKSFAEGDTDKYIVAVFGSSNLCTSFDFPPATYVLPVLWVFVIFLGVMYSNASIFRIYISYLEEKLSGFASVLLIVAQVYLILSLIYFSMIFAVQPDPGNPVTMIVHSVPYLNLKWGICILQVAVVYFGFNVAWVDLNFPSWFYTVSIIHVVIYLIANIGDTLLILNCIGDMGDGMEGKGLWWSVRAEAHKVAFNLIVNYVGAFLGVLVPFVQAVYIARNGSNTDALLVTVGDNKVSACFVAEDDDNRA